MLFWRQVGGDRSIGLQLHGELGAPLQARGQHQAQAMNEGGKVATADPAGQLDLHRGENGLRVNDLFDVPGLGHSGPVGQAHHDALQATGAEGHLHQLTDSHLLL